MDWSKIKTIFIISFLLLDVYLMYQFLVIRNANKYEFVSEVSIEDQLKTDEIKFVELPKVISKNQYLSAKPRIFSSEEVLLLKEQTITVIDGTLIQSILDTPVPLKANFDPLEAQSFINTHALYGDQYGFGEMDELNNTITFYQMYEGKMLYENINGKVTLYLDKKFQIVSFEQTYLEGIENLTEKEEVLPAIKVIETLYERGLLKPKSDITHIELGYSTLVQLAASQVLTPTWHVVVGNQEHFYVNAFEGHIIQFGNEENKIVE